MSGSSPGVDHASFLRQVFAQKITSAGTQQQSHNQPQQQQQQQQQSAAAVTDGSNVFNISYSAEQQSTEPQHPAASVVLAQQAYTHH